MDQPAATTGKILFHPVATPDFTIEGTIVRASQRDLFAAVTSIFDHTRILAMPDIHLRGGNGLLTGEELISGES